MNEGDVLEPILVEERLKQSALKNPFLNILVEGDQMNIAFLLQPDGNLQANDVSGIRPEDEALAASKIESYLRLANTRNAELVMSPEYYCPWQVFRKIGGELIPMDRALWVICLTSITPSTLAEFIEENNQVKWVYDLPNSTSDKFLNPLAYIFRTEDTTGSMQTVVLLQFKTKPMVDTALQLERRHMAEGNRIYLFRNFSNSIHLASIICSDALDFDPTSFFPQWPHLPHILLHPQLNPKPIHPLFRSYRTRWSQLPGDKKQVITLNWAKTSRINGTPASGEDFGRSCFYTKDQPIFGENDHVVNHGSGLYYSFDKDRIHSFYLNFDEFAYEIQISKVGRSNVNAASANPASPRASAYSWNGQSWVAATTINDGYTINCPWQVSRLAPLLHENPSHITKEIIINRSVGAFAGSVKEFHKVKSVNSMDGEQIRRITFVQDQSQESRDYRQLVNTLFRELCTSVLATPSNFPVNISFCSTDPQLGLFEGIFNLSNDGRDLAIVCYLGYVPTDEVAKVYSEICSLTHSYDRRKICVWFKDDNGLQSKVESRTAFNESLDENPADYTREA